MNVRCKIPILTTQTAHRPPILYNEGYNMLTKKEFDILVLLTESKEPMSQREIAEALGISLGAVNKAMQELTEKGCCEKGVILQAGLDALEPYRVKRAVFIAAGFGSRMVPITFNTPKPLVRVNGTRIIDTLLDAVAAAGIPEIVIVRGYLEADLFLRNKHLIRKYEYETNILGIPVDRTDDWCLMTDSSGVVTEETVGGLNCHQMVGISYWSSDDGVKLAYDLDEVYRSPGGKERYWEQVPMVYKKDNYRVHVRECAFEDITEIDTFNELKKIDKLYAI